MEIIEMDINGGKRATPRRINWPRVINTVIQIMLCGGKIGLYVGTGFAVAQAVIQAADVTKSHLVIPGGEIFTIPLIVAILLVGWTFRGDVEAEIRRRIKERRRRQNDRRF